MKIPSRFLSALRPFSVLALLSTVLLSGCSTSPLSPTGEAVYYALQEETSLRAWVDACGDLGRENRRQAQGVQRGWWQRNGAFVESADYGLAYDLVQVSDTRQETGARLAMAITWQVVETAEREVDELMLATSDKSGLCQRMLSQFDRGDRDLRGNDKLYNSLITLQRRAENNPQALDQKRAAVELKTGKRFGRSYYVVEKMTKRQGCPGAQVQLLKNAWPHEVYDAKCPDGSFLLMRCEWGNCLVAE